MSLVLLAFAAPLLLPSDLPLLRIDAPTGVLGFGTFAVDVGDQDGDGVPDVLVAAREATVRLHSGATGALLQEHALPINAIGPTGLVPVDLDQDGDLEVLVHHDRAQLLEVLAIDPSSGAVLWSVRDNTQYLAAPDVEVRTAVLRRATGEPTAVAFGLTAQTFFHPAWWRSSVLVLGLATQGFTLPIFSDHESLGEGVVALGDRDGDGLEEIAVSAPRSLAGTDTGFLAFLGPHGSEWSTSGVPGAELGETLVRVGDVGGDGWPDLVAVEAVGTGWTTLRLRLVDSSNGVTLLTRDFPREAYPGRDHEVEMVPLDDVDGDGIEDFALFAPQVDSIHGEPAMPMLRVHSGATLAALVTWTDLIAELAGSDAERLEIAPAGDLDGDGIRDLLVASPDGPNGGVVAVLRVRPVLGDVGCAAAVPNSTGEIARVALSGTDLLGADDLSLVGSHLPPVAFTLPLASLDVASAPVGGGTLCLGGSILRLNGLLGRSTTAGTVRSDVGIGAWPELYSVTAQVGERWHFQLWYRDLVGGVATSNLSDTRSVLLR